MKLLVLVVFAFLAVSSAYAGVIGAGCCGPAVLAPQAAVVGLAPPTATAVIGAGPLGLATPALAVGGLGHGRGVILG